MITVRANARNATYISDDLITSGSVGIPVTFVLSEDFDGLSAIAVFEGSGTARDVALIGNTCVVPHEVLATAGGYLRIGIYAANSEGTIVIPTVWAGSKMILQGTEPSEVDPSEPTPSWAAQVQEAAAEALANSEEAIEIAGGADAAAEEARESASAAAASATAAGQSANASGTAQTAAEAASDVAASARDAAVAAQGSAENSAQAAAGSATAAAGSAEAAAASEAAAREVQESIPADYTALSEDVIELKSQIYGSEAHTEDVTSSVDWVAGGGVNAPNGAIVSNITTYSHADIPLDGATHVSGYTRAGLEPEKGMCFLDANNGWIAGYYNQGGSSYDWNYSLDVPTNAAYLRICCSTSYISSFSCVLTIAGNAGLVDRVEALEESAGTSDYPDLTNKPSINGTILVGDKTASELGLASADLEIVVNGGQAEIKTDVPLSSFTECAFYIMSNGYWAAQSNGGYVIEIPDSVVSIEITGNAAHETNYALLSAYAPANGVKAPIVGNRTVIALNDTVVVDVASEANYLFVSKQSPNGYNIKPQSVEFIEVGTEPGLVGEINELEHGNSVSYTGSYYQIREGDFKKGSYWRLLLSDTTAASAEITALTDASDTSTAETQFVLYKDKETLWSPRKDYEAIRYGVNGSCKLTINDCTSLFDEIERKIFYCGPSRTYTKLIDAIEAAERYMGSILYVDAGTYDLVDEFGADYFAGITASNSMPGIVLKNRISVIFSPNSRVICHYTGDNQYVLTNFSPFNAGQYGFTVENLNLDSSRTRYAIHDERNGGAEQCVSRYINCNIKQDNSDNASWSSYCCIGGGLGANHEVYIENCTFESIARDGTTVHGTVSYHPSNASGTDFACELVFKDNYFVTGTIELSGSRTDAQNDTTVVVTNNSFEYNSVNSASGIYYSGNQSYQGSHYVVRAWGNEQRQAN